MRRNGYLWASRVNLDTAIRFPDPISCLSAKFRRFGDVFRWLPFDSPTPISCLSAKFRRFGDVFRWFLHFIFWMSAIFLLPVCLTYWPRKHTTRIDPHVDNSHQVWSWYDHPLPSYICLLIRYVTWWPWPLTFWPWTVILDGGSCDQPCHQVWRP